MSFAGKTYLVRRPAAPRYAVFVHEDRQIGAEVLFPGARRTVRLSRQEAAKLLCLARERGDQIERDTSEVAC